MQMLLRALIGGVGVASLFGALMFLVIPGQAAPPFGIAAADALGMSTLRGDFTAVFATIGALSLLAAVDNQRRWLLAPIMLVGCTLAGRLVDLALMGGGAPVLPPIVVEVCLVAVFALGLIKLPRER